MKTPEPKHFDKTHKKTILWTAGGALGGLLLFAILFNASGPSQQPTEPPMAFNSGEASFLNNRADTTEYQPLGDLGLQSLSMYPPDTTVDYVPPPPKELFKESGNEFTFSEPVQPARPTVSNSGGNEPQTPAMYQQALSSDITISEGQPSPYETSQSSRYQRQIQSYRQEAYAIKNGEKFTRAGQSFQGADHREISGDFKVPDTKYTIMEGTLIPATLQTAINSQLPGNIIAFVNRDIYDSIQQKYLLIPKGAKLIGSYNERVVLNQSKLLMSWERIIFPDGRSLRLPSLDTYDMQGQSGLGGKVDRHFWRIFGQSALLSLIGTGTQIAYPNNAGGIYGQQTPGQAVATQIANEFNKVSTQVLQRNLRMAPTISIPAGTEFNIFLAGDLSFQQPYEYTLPGQ